MSTSEKTEKAVLFTDIVGSTPLKPLAGGDTAYFLRILYPHHTKLRQALSSYGGDEIKTTGDGFLILFDDVASAVGYALKAQEYFSTEDFDLDLSVRIRIGIHFGSVLLYEDRPSKDVTGSAVDFAARVCALGNDGQILLSKDASAKLPPEGFHLREWTGYTLKGFQGIHSVFEVQWGPNYRS